MSKEVRQIENMVLLVGTILGAMIASIVAPALLKGSMFWLCLICGGVFGYLGVYMRNSLIEGVIVSGFVLLFTYLFLKIAFLPFFLKQIILASAVGVSIGKIIYGLFDEFMDN